MKKINPNSNFSISLERDCFKCGYPHNIVQTGDLPLFGRCFNCNHELPLRYAHDHILKMGYDVRNNGLRWETYNVKNGKVKVFDGKLQSIEIHKAFQFLFKRKYKIKDE